MTLQVRRTASALLAAAALGGGLTACDGGKAEDAVDKGVQDAKDAGKKAVDDAKDAGGKAVDDAKDTANDAKDKAKDAVDDATGGGDGG
jgi:hypothetical protein